MNIGNDVLFNELMSLDERELKRLVARIYGFIQWKQEENVKIDPNRLMEIFQKYMKEKKQQA